MKLFTNNLTVNQLKSIHNYIKENINSTITLENLITDIEETNQIPIFKNVDEWFLYQNWRDKPWKYELLVEKMRNNIPTEYDNIPQSIKLSILKNYIDNNVRKTTIIGNIIIELENLY